MTAVEVMAQPLAVALEDLRSHERDAALGELASAIAAGRPELDAAAMARAFVERERLGSTAIGGGVALPHCRPGRIGRPLLAVARSAEGIDFAASDGRPVRLLVAIVTPDGAPAIHLRLLAAVARRLREPGALVRALDAPSPAAALEALGLASLPELA